MRRFIGFVLIGALGASHAACDDLQAVDTAECPAGSGPFTVATSRVEGAVTYDPPANPLTRGDLIVLSGTAHHRDGLAVREVRVGSVSAERIAFNFASWRLQLSWEQIIGLAEIDADNNATLALEAVDACGKLYPFATVTLPVDTDPNVRIDSVAVAVTYPDEQASLPADGRTQALVAISASGRPAGARVVVRTSSGVFQGFGGTAEVQLTSPFGDATTAFAQLLLVASQAGTALITAEVKNVIASASVVAVGPPELSPSAGRLQVGNTVTVTVAAGAPIATCIARGDSGWEASIDASVLDLQPTEVPSSALDARGRAHIDVSVSDEAEEDSGITISCEDVHGQSGTARFETDGAP